MIIDSLRILATALLFIAMLIYKIPLQNMFKNCFLQIYIAVFCLIILVFVDNITGFIITLAVLIIYFRVYSKEIKEKTKEYYENENKKINENENEKINQDTNKKPNNMCSGNKCSLEYPERKNNNGINNNSNNSINSNNSVNSINSDNSDNSIKNNIIITQGLQPYITPQHLVAVQTNILDNNIYSDEITDINVLPDEYKSLPVYKSQGLNTDNYHLRGFDNYNKEYGTLDFKNLFDN